MAGSPPAGRRLTRVATGTALGLYGLLVAGAVAGVLDGSRACGVWPVCDGGLAAVTSEPGVLVAAGHRILALVVGVALATAVVLAWRHGSRRVGLALGLAGLAYPGQLALGAATATGMAVAPTAHLLVGVGIFVLVVIGLVWHLEAHHADAAEIPSVNLSASPGPAADETDGTGLANGISARTRLGAYVRLTKPKLMWLLCLVALAAMAMAAGPALDPGLAIATLAGGVLAVGASGTFNHVLEAGVDREMDRTADRPLVTGIVPRRRAIAFGAALTIGATAVFLAFVNPVAAALGLLAIGFYSVIYTLVLKPRTAWNTVLGGAVGAFPALIGWAAVTGSVGVPALLIGGLVFLWTPAHFYNLALAYRVDYARAGIPMVPVVHGPRTARRRIAWYLAASLVAALGLGAVTGVGWLYGLAALVGGAAFLLAVVDLHRERSEGAALRAFHASNAFLGLVLLATVLEGLLV